MSLSATPVFEGVPPQAVAAIFNGKVEQGLVLKGQGFEAKTIVTGISAESLPDIIALAQATRDLDTELLKGLTSTEGLTSGPGAKNKGKGQGIA